MGSSYDFLDVNDSKIDEIWRRYLSLRGLRSESDPIPAGETAETFRRKWEKFLYSQRPSGAVGTTPGTTVDADGGIITEVTPAPVKIEAGELPEGVEEADALKAGAVLLYEHKDYGGKVYVLPRGSYKWIEDAGIPNDLISSVKVPPGVVLKLWEHKDFGGRVRTVTGNSSFISDFNDMASAAKVERKA